MDTKSIIPADYQQFITDMKSRILAARIHAARAVNREMILLYWDIGRSIVEKQKVLGWGKAVIERLAKDLQTAFPGVSGFSARNLWDMRRLYETYSADEFLRQVAAELPESSPDQPLKAMLEIVTQLPWGHHLVLMSKVSDPAAHLYYIRTATQFGWSRNVLLNQIKANAYERTKLEKKSNNFALVLPKHLAEQADEAMKSAYNLEFLGIAEPVHERELENRLIERLQEFMLELGYGFCFIGRQYRVTVGDKEYFIDLLFYHRFLRALVAIELKVGDFEPEFAGKMDFYLNILNTQARAPDDNPSIGIILCAAKDELVVEFSLKSKTNPIGVAEYTLTAKLPQELEGVLPTEAELRAALLPIEDKAG